MLAAHNIKRYARAATAALGLILTGAAARADVVVVANRARAPVEFEIALGEGRSKTYRVEVDDLVSIPIGGETTLVFSAAKERSSRTLAPNWAYFFFETPETKQLGLERIGLVGAKAAGDGAGLPAADQATPPPGNSVDLLTIRVKLLVDEEERAARPRWEARLRKRLRSASAIFERYARVRFAPAGLEEWKSSNDLKDVDASLQEFERRVDPAPADLAIGFTSQYEVPSGRFTLGGVRGALRTHILIREWSQHVSEAERLEILVHELGHYLGAVHSPENDSVMRPRLGDRQAVARDFRVRLDPLNTLAVCLVVDEMRARPIARLADLKAPTRERLAEIYSTLITVLPDDPAAGAFLSLLGRDALRRHAHPAAPSEPDPAAQPDRPGTPRPVVHKPMDAKPAARDSKLDRREMADATRAVLKAVVDAAESNRRLREDRPAGEGDQHRLAGDALTERYVSVAAMAAAYQPAEHRRQAFFLALAMAVDTSQWLRDLPVIGGFLRQIEPQADLQRRLRVIGSPTMRARHDLALHFFVSAAITANAGREAAEAAGMAKELGDADGGSGFSFCDWTADLAGIALAEQVAAAEASLSQMASRFAASDYLPSVANLPEGLTRGEFVERFGSTSDRRFKQLDEKVRKRIADLPNRGKSGPN